MLGPMVELPDAWPIPLELATDIPLEAPAGFALSFVVSADVVINGAVAVPKGAPARGEVHGDVKRGRAAIRVTSVRVADGSDVTLRATAGATGTPNRPIETRGARPDSVAVVRGATAIGYVAGKQPVRAAR